MINIITIILVLGAPAAIASWQNTQIILRDGSEIKDKLSIKEAIKPSRLITSIVALKDGLNAFKE